MSIIISSPSSSSLSCDDDVIIASLYDGGLGYTQEAISSTDISKQGASTITGIIDLFLGKGLASSVFALLLLLVDCAIDDDRVVCCCVPKNIQETISVKVLSCK